MSEKPKSNEIDFLRQNLLLKCRQYIIENPFITPALRNQREVTEELATVIPVVYDLFGEKVKAHVGITMQNEISNLCRIYGIVFTKIFNLHTRQTLFDSSVQDIEISKGSSYPRIDINSSVSANIIDQILHPDVYNDPQRNYEDVLPGEIAKEFSYPDHIFIEIGDHASTVGGWTYIGKGLWRPFMQRDLTLEELQNIQQVLQKNTNEKFSLN